MLPGRRADNGSIFVVQGPAPVGALMEGGIAVTPLGAIYISELATSFSPIDLFQNNEQGAWYDPSDLPTMFQDAAGTTPVTADGQPVGLILDKSKGLVLGAEQITAQADRDFSSDTGWWSKGAGATISGGVVNVNIAVDDYPIYRFNFPLQAGYYEMTYTLTVASGSINAQISTNNYGIGPARTASGTYTDRLYAIGSNSTTGFRTFGPFVGTIDNVSIRLVEGNPASQDTAAKRPLYKTSGLAKYNDYDVVDDVLNTTFPSSLGSACTVAKAVVGGSPTILTGQTIGTSWAESTDNAGVVIVNRALTPQETTDLTAWLTAKGATT